MRTANCPDQAGAVKDMAQAAGILLAGLDADQKSKACFPLTDDERLNWHYVPTSRKGLSLAAMRPEQDHLVYGLLGAALSADGLRKTTSIMSLEKILFELENQAPHRNPESYFITIFGEPKTGQAWGWRFEGHHCSLNFAIGSDNQVVLTPTFLGANPGEVKDGPRAGLRALAEEEDFARELARSLTPEQQKTAILPGNPLAELLSGQDRSVKFLEPAGISARDLTEAQRALLWKVISEYIGRFRPDLTVSARESLGKDGGNLSFAWSGSTQEGAGHYYRIQSPQFLFEYDNTQNNAKHPHTVWRDFNGDFGRDLLKDHYFTDHSSTK